MEGIITILVLALFIATGVYAECILWAYYSVDSRFDGYMGLKSEGIKQLSSRSQMDCESRCTAKYSCMSNTFDPETKLCHLFNRTLTSTAGLQPTPGAVYHYKSRIVNRHPFKCHRRDDDFHPVNFGSGSCIEIRAVHNTLNHADAAADCKSKGGRLMVIDTAEKKELFFNLASCPGFDSYYLVDGSNVNATDYSAVDAYTTSFGEVITVGNLLWMVYSNTNHYNPATEHCLSYHRNHLNNVHHHTVSCSTRDSYLCEKEYNF